MVNDDPMMLPISEKFWAYGHPALRYSTLKMKGYRIPIIHFLTLEMAQPTFKRAHKVTFCSENLFPPLS